MRILIDTNILISSVLFPNSKIAKVVIYVSDFYEIVLTQQIIEEFRRIIALQNSMSDKKYVKMIGE